MTGFDGLQEIFATMRQNKLRTLLTAFGVFWGIFMLILLLGAGKGLQHGVEDGFSNDVSDSIWIWSRTTSVPYKGLGVGREVHFTESDMEAIKQQLPGVRFISSENPLGSFRRADIVVTYGNKSASFGVLGVADQYFNIKPKVDFLAGRKLDPFDQRDSRKIVVAGRRVVEQLFPPGADPVGETLSINGVTFRIVGVFWDKGWEGRLSERLYMPLSAFQKTFGGGERVNLIAVRPEPGYDPFEVERQVVDLLKRRHNVSPADRRAISSNNMAKQAQRFNAVFAGINGFIWFVGIGTLVAGIVGVSNIMIITVKERTREIGVRKALGATPGRIVGGLLFESVLITGVAGYLGLVLGVMLLEFVTYTLETMQISLPFFQRPEVNFQVAITAVVLLVAAGALAGLMPALKAARIMPVEAMRAE